MSVLREHSRQGCLHVDSINMSASNELKALRDDSQNITVILSSDSDTVEWLCSGLVNKGLLSEECESVVRSKVSNEEKVRLLQRKIEEQVEADAIKFHVFIELLKEKRKFSTLIAKLLNSLARLSKQAVVAYHTSCKQPQLKKAKLDNEVDYDCRHVAVTPSRCGCGQCSIEGFFKVGYARLREESSYPFVNKEDLTQCERLCLVEQLSSGSKEMYEALQNAKMEFQDWAKDSMSLQQLKDCLLSLQGMDSTYSGVPCMMFEDSMEEIEGSVSVCRVLYVIHDYCSWFNHYILEHVVSNAAERFGGLAEEFEDKLATFKAVMENYCRRKIIECPSLAPSFIDPSGRFFRLRLNLDHLSLRVSDVQKLHLKFAQILTVQVYALKLCYVGDGSACLSPCKSITQFIYSVPQCIYKLMFPLSEEQLVALAEVGVVELQSDTFCLAAPDDLPVLVSSLPVYMCPEDHEKLLLHYGTKGDVGRMKVLVEAGYKPGVVRDSNGCTALHLACSEGHETMIRYLVSLELCDPNDRDNAGDSALDKLCHIEYYYLIKYFLTLKGIDASGKGCQRLMLKYATEGEFQTLKALVEAGCDPRTARDKKGRTALHRACRQGWEYMVTYLTMEQHCDPNVRDIVGESPLDKACRWNHLNIVHFLLGLMEIDPTGPGCQKLLLKCAHKGNMVTLKKLVEAGCNPQFVKNKMNQTALHAACNGGNLDVVQYLVTKAHCDPNERDTKGKSCLDVAIQADCKPLPLPVIDYLMGIQGIDLSGSDCSQLLGECAEKGNVQLLRKLVESGCSPRAWADGGCHPLEIACTARQYDVVRYLCSLPGVRATGVPCLKLLCEASKNGDLQTVRALVQCGCDPQMARGSCSHTIMDIVREHDHNRT